jgi:hypothetical protein
MTRANCIGSVEPPMPSVGPERDRARERRERDLQHTEKIDAVGVEVPILVIEEAPPVVLGHFAHGDRFVIGVGDISAERNGGVRIVDIALAIKARVKGPDKRTPRVVDRGREPAFPS